MPWTVRISKSAKTDISDIKKWYKEQSLQTLENFTDEVMSRIESLKNDLTEHKTVHGEYKRLLIAKFPYTIYYKRDLASNRVDVVAILHNKRDRDAILKQLFG